MPKFNLRDKFIRKGIKDSSTVMIVEIVWQEHNEPIYTLSNMYYYSEHYEIGEEALEKNYQKKLKHDNQIEFINNLKWNLLKINNYEDYECAPGCCYHK